MKRSLMTGFLLTVLLAPLGALAGDGPEGKRPDGRGAAEGPGAKGPKDKPRGPKGDRPGRPGDPGKGARARDGRGKGDLGPHDPEELKKRRKERLEKQAERLEERAGKLREQGNAEAADKLADRAKKMRERADRVDQPVDENANRKRRKFARVRRLHARYGDALKDPKVKEEILLHSRRTAKLQRMRRLAREAQDNELTQELNQLVRLEDKRHTQVLAQLAPNKVPHRMRPRPRPKAKPNKTKEQK